MNTDTRRINIDFIWSMPFWFFQIGNIIEGFGYFLPSIHLPCEPSSLVENHDWKNAADLVVAYAMGLGFSEMTATLTVSLLNATTTFGLIFTGLLVDRLHISTVLSISAIGSATSVFLLWGLAINKPILFVFAITFGVFAGGFSATWSGCAAEIRKDYREAEVAVIMGVLAAGRGFGCMLSGPASEWLIRIGKQQNEPSTAYGTKFGSLIIFTGITMLWGRLGLVGSIGRRAKDEKSMEPGSEEDPLLGD